MHRRKSFSPEPLLRRIGRCFCANCFRRNYKQLGLSSFNSPLHHHRCHSYRHLDASPEFCPVFGMFSSLFQFSINPLQPSFKWIIFPLTFVFWARDRRRMQIAAFWLVQRLWQAMLSSIGYSVDRSLHSTFLLADIFSFELLLILTTGPPDNLDFANLRKIQIDLSLPQ